jgi:hypothetical protein
VSDRGICTHSLVSQEDSAKHRSAISLRPKIDTPAADAHATLLANGVQALNPQQRMAWARFLISFGVRTPETLRTLGPQQYRRAMALDQSKPRESPEVETVVNALIASEMRALERNVPLQIAMELITDPNHFLTVANMHWWLRRFDSSCVLLGDRPLLSQPTANWPCGIAIDDLNCLIALPISPSTVFFASANVRLRSETRRTPASGLLHNVNQRTIECVVEYVFAADNSMRAFVQERLRGRPNAWPRSSTPHTSAI